MKLLVIDGNSIVNRAFYGVAPLTTKNGQPTNALVGFMNILQRLERETTPDEVAIAFDLKAPTFRHKMYDGYKAQRKSMPEELAQQMPVLKELLTALGYKLVSKEGFEADDILGTLAKNCEERNDTCVLATGDRDSFQLISPGTNVLLLGSKMGKSTTTLMDEAAIQEKYELTPKQMIDLKSLMGDSSDNIPGVTGVGEKTALLLIQSFGNLAGVYENIEDARIKKGVREKLLRDKAQAEMSYQLAKIDCNAPVETAQGTYQKASPDAEKATALLTELEMHATLKKLNLSVQPILPSNLKHVPIKPLLPLSGTVSLCLLEEKVLIVQNEDVYTDSIDSTVFLSLLCNPEIKKNCFDAKALYRIAFSANKEAVGIIFDAKLAAYLQNPSASNYTILELAQEYNILPNFACECSEAAVLEALCTTLREKCNTDGMTPLLDEIELPLSEVLAEMEHLGILVDKEGIQTFGTQLQEVLAQELSTIYQMVGYEFNVNSPKQLGKALFEDMGLPTRKKTKTGWSTNAETLESLRIYSPVIEHILQYRTYQKLNSTYVEGLLKVIEDDNRIHSTFYQTETRTGRISSAEPNLQNIPVRTELGSQFRKYFIAPNGTTLLDADYSQIELRIMAHIANDEHMCKAFEAGEDIHRATAARIYGVPIEEVTSAMRSSVKAINFGIIYGKGAYSLSQDLNISVKEADTFIKTYLGSYPNVQKYMDETIAFGKENGYVATLYGRRRALPELASGNFNLRSQGERMALNTPIQGSAADVIKIAMVRVFRRLRKEGLQARLILQVHDELIVECPLEEYETASRILGEEMRAAAQLRVPLVADVNSGDTWYAAKG